MVLKNWHPIPAVHHHYHQKAFPILKQETSSFLFTNKIAAAIFHSSSAAAKHFFPPSSFSHSFHWKTFSLSPSNIICCIPYNFFMDFLQLLPNSSAAGRAPELLCHRLCASSWSSHCLPYWHFFHIPLQLQDSVASCSLLKLTTCPEYLSCKLLPI